MINFNNPKTKKTFAGILAAVIVFAMVIGMLLPAFI